MYVQHDTETVQYNRYAPHFSIVYEHTKHTEQIIHTCSRASVFTGINTKYTYACMYVGVQRQFAHVGVRNATHKPKYVICVSHVIGDILISHHLPIVVLYSEKYTE